MSMLQRVGHDAHGTSRTLGPAVCAIADNVSGGLQLVISIAGASPRNSRPTKAGPVNLMHKFIRGKASVAEHPAVDLVGRRCGLLRGSAGTPL